MFDELAGRRTGVRQLVNEVFEGDQLSTEMSQLGDPFVDVADLPAQHISDIATGLLSAIAQRDDLANLIEGDAQPLRRLDEGEKFYGPSVVVPVPGFGAFRLR